MSADFGSILFKPTCSNCGRVINGDVEYRSDFNYQTITPNICPHCGCTFDGIVLPNATRGEDSIITARHTNHTTR